MPLPRCLASAAAVLCTSTLLLCALPASSPYALCNLPQKHSWTPGPLIHRAQRSGSCVGCLPLSSACIAVPALHAAPIFRLIRQVILDPVWPSPVAGQLDLCCAHRGKHQHLHSSPPWQHENKWLTRRFKHGTGGGQASYQAGHIRSNLVGEAQARGVAAVGTRGGGES